MMRPRVAPSERRIAISCWRRAPRTSSKFATFVQTIASTTPTATTSTRSAGATAAVSSSSVRTTSKRGVGAGLRLDAAQLQPQRVGLRARRLERDAGGELRLRGQEKN